MDLTTAVISGIAGMILSLALNFIPGLRVKWAGLQEDTKKAYMALLVLATGGLIALSSCLNLWVIVQCDKPGLMYLVQVVFFTLVGNQVTYLVTPQPADVKQAKIARYYID